ncbi:MAG: phage holin family protein [Sphingobacteriales bacterium]|uniref:phage holin family protein n=1 Tax=Hydrotalea flava TaxID=714549 RepID=UPI000835A17B|nr:phage holin family protein [Hydrotalea flava]RTL49874.1 MAG: phage holin family protein [Sphingobacteriales bacterium]
MVSFLSKVLFTAVAILLATFILNGVHVNSTATAILVAAVLGLLNTFVKPILVLLTIPFTILTLGLFLLVINVIIIKWTSVLVPGFRVDGWWPALWFSIIVSLVSSFIEGLVQAQE